MRLFASFTCYLQFGAAAPVDNNYDYLDFFALVHKLEKLREDKYKVSSQLPHHQAVLIDVPTKLKKVGEGIEIDVEKTSKNGNKLGRKKSSNDASYDDYYAYQLPDYNYYANNDAGDYGDDYYFYPDDIDQMDEEASGQEPQTETLVFTPPPPVVQAPRPVVQAPRPTAHHRPAASHLPANLQYGGNKVSAPKPPSSATSERHIFSDYEYEYYDVFYYDDLGMKKKKRKKRKKRKKKTKNDPINYGTNFQCWECLSANSYDDCRDNGQYRTCNGGSIGCKIEVRSRRTPWYDYTNPRQIEKIDMGCKQLKSCVVEHKYNSASSVNFQPQCFEEDSTWHKMLQVSNGYKGANVNQIFSGVILPVVNAAPTPVATING